MSYRIARPIVSFSAIAAVFLVQPIPPVTATTVVRMNLEEMAAQSPSIVHGTVVSTESKWNEERSLILTDVRIRVLDTVKGETATEVVVQQPGGVVGNIKVDVPGMSIFRPGDEVVLFLAPGGRGNLHVNGLTQGRFDVIKDPTTGERTVRGLTPEQMARLVPVGTLSHGADGPPVQKESVPLDEFLDGVRRLSLVSDGGVNR